MRQRRSLRFDTAALLSALLLVVMGILWIDSCMGHSRGLVWNPASGGKYSRSDEGRLYSKSGSLHWAHDGRCEGGLCPWWFPEGRLRGYRTASRSRAFAGFGIEYRVSPVAKAGCPSVTGDFDVSLNIQVPLWALTVGFAVAPLLWLQSHNPWTRRRPGTCHVCGYDLRGISERCPECGTTIAPE